LFDVTGEHGPRRGLFQTRQPDGERPGGCVVAQEADRRVGAAQAGLCGDVDDEPEPHAELAVRDLAAGLQRILKRCRVYPGEKMGVGGDG
jgi:hypothetical protein